VSDDDEPTEVAPDPAEMTLAAFWRRLLELEAKNRELE